MHHWFHREYAIRLSPSEGLNPAANIGTAKKHFLSGIQCNTNASDLIIIIIQSLDLSTLVYSLIYWYFTGTPVYGNVWGPLHDPKVYPEPHKFKPDRFLGKKGKFVRPDPRYFSAFSAGKLYMLTYP